MWLPYPLLLYVFIMAIPIGTNQVPQNDLRWIKPGYMERATQDGKQGYAYFDDKTQQIWFYSKEAFQEGTYEGKKGVLHKESQQFYPLDVRQIASDLDFQKLPIEEQRKAFAEYDRDFALLPVGEQDKVIRELTGVKPSKGKTTIGRKVWQVLDAIKSLSVINLI